MTVPLNRARLLERLVRRQRIVRWPTQWLRLASTSAASPTDDTSISAALLQRAKATAAEHASLSNKLSSTYDSTSAKRLGELTPVTHALKSYSDAQSSLSELHQLIADPSSDKELKDLASQDLDSTHTLLQSASRSLTQALIPRHPFAHLPCLLEIRPGVGGSEAALFAADLLRMYTAYCTNHNLQATLLKYEAMDGQSDPNGSDAPMAEAILEVSSPGAYGKLRGEAGVHRVQRVPATESKGRTHTSAASVLVLPSFPEESGGEEKAAFDDPSSDYFVNPADVRTDVMRARGAGGQHVNTTDSAVRLTHVPTNTVVACQDQRSQLKNRAKAWIILRGKLAQAKREAREEEMLALRRSSAGGQGKSNRSDKVRTYNYGQQRVTDHRSGFGAVGSLDSVMAGEDALEDVMESVRQWTVEKEVEEMMLEEEAKRKRTDVGEKGQKT